MTFKILSFNIHKGLNWNNFKFFLPEMKKIIINSEADIVFLQEVVGENNLFKNKGYIDKQFEFLADQLWPHFSYGKNAVYEHGHHGNLILSKYPIEHFENINITTNKFEKRGMLICKININGKKIYAACLHLNLLHSGRLNQYSKIENHYDLKKAEFDLPMIIAGDFNDWNNKSPEIFEKNMGMHEAYFEIHGKYAKTFPAHFPLLRLDRIYFKKLKIINSDILISTKEKAISDHLALMAEFDFYEE